SSQSLNGAYGTLGVSSTTNLPGTRSFGGGFVDSNDDIWIFAGLGYGETGNQGLLNDLWKYTNCSSQSISVGSNPTLPCSGTSVTLTAAGANSFSWSLPASGPSVVVTPTAGISYSITSLFPNGCIKNLPFSLNVGSAPIISYVNSSPSICI